MDNRKNLESAKQTASQLNAEIEALPLKNTPNVRAIRRRYSRHLKAAPAGFILDLARERAIR